MTKPQICLAFGIGAWVAVWWWIGEIVLTVTTVAAVVMLFGWLILCIAVSWADE